MVEHFVPPFDFERDESVELRNALRGITAVARNRRQQIRNAATWHNYDLIFAIPCTPCWVIDVVAPAECCMPQWERLQYQHAIAHWQYKAKQSWMLKWQCYREWMIVEERSMTVSLQHRVYQWHLKHRCALPYELASGWIEGTCRF